MFPAHSSIGLAGLKPGIRIIQANKPEEYAEALILFKEYLEFLGQDLAFQGLEEEFKDPVRIYGPPNGCLLLALVDEKVAGCVALREKTGGACEMKRLFVKPAYRGMAIGKALCGLLLQKARQLRYRVMLLDTLRSLQEALHLYQQLGFTETAPYYHNPLKDVVFMEKTL